MQQKKRILICPLDWGLGHATRCIPIIRLLLKKNVEVIIAANKRPLALLQKEFPDLTFIELPGYNITYLKSGSMIYQMLVLAPSILKGIKQEHQNLDKIISEHKIDIVISDNRFGCWNKNVKSIFITHQLMIKAPFAEKLLHRKNLKYIQNYHECWVPDNEGANNLSGELSHKYKIPKNTFFIGSLSRFEKTKTLPDLKYDIMAIVSGPEPQRGIFEISLLAQLSQTNLKCLLVEGITETEQTKETTSNTEIYSHLNSSEMQEAILSSKLIIARSGYSTIMDLATLGKKAIFIPTPGQTEQEYLAKELKEKKIAYAENQKGFDLKRALQESEKYIGFTALNNSKNLLEERIDQLLKPSLT